MDRLEFQSTACVKVSCVKRLLKREEEKKIYGQEESKRIQGDKKNSPTRFSQTLIMRYTGIRGEIQSV
jgi:hypothetical protein